MLPGEPTKVLLKHGFPQLMGFARGYNAFWPPKCGLGAESLIRKGL
jgi:hypothetical protein